MDKEQLKSFLHGSAISMVGVGTLGIMNYFIRRTMSSSLSETDFGFFYSALALVSIVMIFIDLGLGQATIILMAKSFAANDLQESKKIFTITFAFKILFALLAFSILEALSPYLMHYYFKYPGSYSLLMLMLMFLLIPVQTLNAILLPVISARKAFVIKNILSNIKTFIILTGIFLSVKSYGIQSCILWFIIGSLIIALLSSCVVNRFGITLLPFKSIKYADFKNIFSISSWIAISTAGISIMYYMDTLCLTWLMDLKSVALYNIALPLMQIAQSFFVFPAIFTPYVAEMWQQHNYSGIRRTCLIGSGVMLLTLPVFVLGGYYFATDLVVLLFPKKFIGAAPAVTILWSGMVFFSIARFNINALNAESKQKNVAYMVISCVVLNFILNTILISLYGFIGAALATTITYFVLALGAIISLIVISKQKELLFKSINEKLQTEG